jgi:hypothetical protein
MLHFAERVATSEKFPSLLFGFKPLDSAVRIHNATTPECVKHAVVCTVYSVVLGLSFTHCAAHNGIAEK